MLHKLLMRDDLPTLLLPMNTNSGRSAGGHFCQWGEEVMNLAEVMGIGKEEMKDYLFFLNRSVVHNDANQCI